ncbi:uncharacterized protein ARMOST_22548 [Armillaria ostoyae]|uniref:Uncharacterized protein n=1 Tax=Armillaria ostoyae TaxID=47428 RepID=A0A284SD78_ARMOS|nr:uncharacterized protein ARMOST_22548 [Armillaria ostoyae]
MAKPSSVRDTAALQHEALSTYEAAAVLLQHKAGFAPNNCAPNAVDKWISDAYVQWALCDEFWKPAGIKKKVWNDLEYAVLEKVARVDQDDISWAGSDFNKLALHMHDYGLHVHPIPLEPRTPSPLPSSQKPSAPSPLPSKQQSMAPATPRHSATKPTPDLSVPVNKLNLMAPSPDASTLTSRTQVPVKTALSIPAQAMLKPPVPNPSSSSANIAQPPVSNPSKPANQAGQQTAPLQKKVTPRPLNLEAIQSSKTMLPSSTAPKKLASLMKPKVLAPPSGATTSLPPQTGVDNSGWGSPARSHVSLTDDPPPSLVENFVSFPKDFTSPLHKKPDQQLKIGPPSNTTHSEASAQSLSSRPLAVNAPDRSTIVPGPDASLQPDGTIPYCPPTRLSLFFPGTDEEEERVQEDLVQGEQVPGTDSEDSNFQGPVDDAPTSPMDVDKNKGQQSDDNSSPLPTQSCHKTHQISFVFNDVTGDFEEPHPTIFLPRRPAPQEQNPCCSTRPHTSPVNQDVAYLKMTQGSKPLKVKKDKKHRVESLSKKDAKGKKKELVPLKHVRNDNNDSHPVDMPATKKLKSKDAKVDEAEEAINTFESTLNAIEVNNAAVTSLVQQFLAGLDVLLHTESIRIQSSHLHKCLNPVEEVIADDEDNEVEEVAEGVVGLSKKKKLKSG